MSTPTPETQVREDVPWVQVEPSPRWVRVEFNGEIIADSRRVLLLREKGFMPVYYFPREDVRMDLLVPTDRRTQCRLKGEARYWTLQVGDRQSTNAAWSYEEPTIPERRDIAGYIAFYWNKVDRWFEEEEEVFVHPRDPYRRVDVVPSSRHVKVVIGGQVVAESRRPWLLFETGLPTRYYFDREDVSLDLLEPTRTQTRCPYKGLASDYWKVKEAQDDRDVAWSYPDPIPECPKVRGRIAFFNERVEAIVVDGQEQPRPQTPWS